MWKTSKQCLKEKGSEKKKKEKKRMKKLDEDLGPDREDEFQTDDEEDQAERVCDVDDGADTESDVGMQPSRNESGNEINDFPAWPQSYR